VKLALSKKQRSSPKNKEKGLEVKSSGILPAQQCEAMSSNHSTIKKYKTPKYS
jgi:hypothetical protein